MTKIIADSKISHFSIKYFIFNLQATSSDTSVAEHQNESFDYACKQINNELVEIARRENNSVLLDKSFDGLASYDKKY